MQYFQTRLYSLKPVWRERIDLNLSIISVAKNGYDFRVRKETSTCNVFVYYIDVMYKEKGKEIVIEILAICSQNIFVNAHFEYFCEEKINESLHTSINNIKSYEVHVYIPAQ